MTRPPGIPKLRTTPPLFRAYEQVNILKQKYTVWVEKYKIVYVQFYMEYLVGMFGEQNFFTMPIRINQFLRDANANRKYIENN